MRMTKKEEIITCDRCGAVIDKTPRDVKFLHVISCFRTVTRLCVETAEKEGYLADGLDTIAEIPTVNVVLSYNHKEKNFDLCRKCRKEFEKFMKQEV